MKTTDVFKHVALYGQTAKDDPDFAGPIADDFTLNSPIGCCMDKEQRLWICDTGNNRVLVLDKDLRRILKVLTCPQLGAKGEAGLHFRMPFHLCQHPQKKLMYLTDMGNSRVVVMEYSATDISFSHAFGTKPNNGGLPLQDPNGITIVKDKSNKYFVHVNDEFFHTPSDKLRNRCVRYTDAGEYVSEFRGVREPSGKEYDIYWPQGLSSDQAGNLYLANTGNYQILKIAADAPVDANYVVQSKQPVVQHLFEQPRGMGMMNIMRYVNVINQHIFVPDQILNSISVYAMNGKLSTVLSGMRSVWNHQDEAVRSPTDWLYYNQEDAILLNPYVICQGEAQDIYFVTEPFTSRLLKLKIPNLEGPVPGTTLIEAIGARRNQPGKPGVDPQFNCVSAVTLFKRPLVTDAPPIPALPKLPDLPWFQPAPGSGKAGPGGNTPNQDLPPWLTFNPWQQAYMAWSAVATASYNFWFGTTMDAILRQSLPPKEAAGLRMNMDAGNWRLKNYQEQSGKFTAVKENPVQGLFLEGNLSTTLYYPPTPLLGQICPGTPILLMANFDFAVVSMYQLAANGEWINYGLPFGYFGTGPGGMRGPQGMCVSSEGELFIADSLNNRIGKWQILQTGQVVFCKNFVWEKGKKGEVFTPTDLALDRKQHLFVTDQFNNRLCVFDREGNSLWSYGVEGYWQEGQPDGSHFMLPTSLAIDGDHLIVNDLVNRALKLFKIESLGLQFVGGISLFKLTEAKGGVWMPFFICAHQGQVYVADSTYNIVQVFEY